MKKIYLFICTLMCMMGVTSAYADKTELKLSGADAQMKTVNCSLGTSGLAETEVISRFTGESAWLSSTGMVWGTNDGANVTGDFQNGSETGFTFLGRPARGGEYVAQMFDLTHDVCLLNLSFELAGASQMAFSVWKVDANNASATKLMEKTSDWSSNNSFFIQSETDGELLLSSSDKLLLVWANKAGGSVSETISNFTATIYSQISTKQVKVIAYDGESPNSAFEGNLNLPVIDNYNLKSYLPKIDLLEYENKTVSVTDATTELTIKYTENVPFATTYAGLGADEDDNKWVSMMTYNGRIYIYDADSETNNGKYPCIDRVTFTNLKDKKFWGFICENPFVSSAVKIVNKGAGVEKGCLYYTGSGSSAGTPLLFATADEASSKGWTNNEWVIEKGQTKDGNQYYGIKSKEFDQYINNLAGQGYMVTYEKGASGDQGSNIKFTGELETYNIMRTRALNAPCNAVHGLNAAARALINSEGGSTITGYKAVIQKIITDDDPNAGFVTFDETGSKYYVLRNYTPVDGDTYLLSSEDGSVATVFQVPSNEVGSADNVMKISNINTIWKITANPNAPTPTNVGSNDVGVSKTIGRFVTHVNSQKYLTDGSTIATNGNSGNTNDLSSVTTYPLGETGMNWYFVNLGAGQHFMKTKQYTGSGQQAGAMPLSLVQSNGKYVLQRKSFAAHYKNTRDAWYGIEVKGIEVTIGSTGYATIYLPFGVTLPDGLTAYAVTAADNTTATMIAKTSIPACQGAILKGTENTTYTLTIDDNASWGGITNLLQGSNMVSYVEGEGYVLADGTSGVGLYKAELNKGANGAEGTTHFQNNGNKAYLKHIVPGARFLSFDFGTETGLDVIKGKEPASSESVVYDLSGRRVRNAQKGMYIVNGKKVIK